MGLGRFGVAGCCKCSPDTPTVGETAGPCGWCGYYDPAEFTLQYPIPEDKLCQRRLADSFSTSKDYPRVPWWGFQKPTDPGKTWQERWARGDYQHLNDGHYCYTKKEPLRYAQVSGAPWRTHLKELLWDTGGVFQRLENLPPVYGSFYPYTYDYPKRYENGLIINSPTDKTDLIPLKQYMSLEFNTPKSQWPQQVSWIMAGVPFPCLFEPCPRTWDEVVAAQVSELFPYPYGPTAFGWNAPGQPPGLGYSRNGYGLVVTIFRVESKAVVPIDHQYSQQLYNLKEYLPKTQKLTMGYYVGSNGTYVGREAEGWKEVEIPYQENFSLKLEVQFDDYPVDNRKCWLTVKFLMNDNVYFTQQHLIAKPGWRQTGAATDAQAFIQSFCPSQISARNEISGVFISRGSLTGWYYELLALWSPRQTPRESYWMDNWQARLDRL